MSLAREYQPDAITLDLHLPDMDGWSVLARLKEDSATRHIPVHIISVDEERDRGLRAGALSFLNKPATKETLDDAFTNMQEFIAKGVRNLLVVEDNADQRNAILELVADPDVEVDAVGTGAEALAIMRSKHIDCMVMDLGLPDMDGFEHDRDIKKDPALREVPIVVYTGKDLTTKQEAQLREVAQSIIIKDVRSPERLLDETALFLHRVQKRLPEHKRKMLEQLHQSDALLHGKKVLVVDDDIRNIFAMTSLLERHGMEVATAENGKDAIQILEKGLRHRRGADGHHDAGDGRLRYHAGHPPHAAVPGLAHRGPDGESHEGRPREVHRGRGQRLHLQAGGYRSAFIACCGSGCTADGRA